MKSLAEEKVQTISMLVLTSIAVAILLSLIFFGAIWGIIGMFLATPITAVLKILFERFEYTAPIANLLSAK